MKKAFLLTTIFSATLLVGCANTAPPPVWSAPSNTTEAEYAPYLKTGTGSVSGQAFLSQQGGNTVKAAGKAITLDPATTTGVIWWEQAGKYWANKALTPPSVNFAKARRTTTGDADGRFKISNVPAGKYYIRTEVTWFVPYIGDQGGLVGQLIEVKDNQITEVILNQFAQ